MTTLHLRHWSATHEGAVRSVNQDALLCRPDLGLYAVADGAGGHTDGALAARTTLEHLGAAPDGCAPDTVLAAVRRGAADAHHQLRDAGLARAPSAVLATTLVVLLVHDEYFACLWAGDSRCYLQRHGVLHRLTTDHSVVQSLVDAGEIDAAQAEHHPLAHVITRAIGAGDADIQLDKTAGTLAAGDRLVLCSDGLYKALTDEAIVSLVAGERDPAQGLVDAAVHTGARDNVTVVIVEAVERCR